ncbi:MAG: hypothetical protein ACFE8B_14210 [Candidatus Hermodarchaeota archaeon]
MDNKDILIGILLIGIVGISGGLGYLLIAGPEIFGPASEGSTNLFGLPDDWNTAPNASYFTIYNQTGASIQVTLKDILDGVALALEEQAAGGPEINEYKDIIYPYTFLDPVSGYYLTGVDLLDILEKYDTALGWDLTITSSYGHTLEITTGEIISRMYHGTEDPIIVAIAANKRWLGESPLAPSWGNFSFIGKQFPSAVYDITQVEVMSNWTVDVVVDGEVEYIIDLNNMNLNEYNDEYHYYRDDWWDFHRLYWGRNISEIISHTPAAGKNYTVRFWSADDWATPWPFGGKKELRYNNTHVEEGITPPYPQWANGNLNTTADLINATMVPMPKSDLLMALVYADQELGETGQGITDPIWPYRRLCGYHRGPFYVIIPGRPRNTYLSHIVQIDITTYTGPIPSGFYL